MTPVLEKLLEVLHGAHQRGVNVKFVLSKPPQTCEEKNKANIKTVRWLCSREITAGYNWSDWIPGDDTCTSPKPSDCSFCDNGEWAENPPSECAECVGGQWENCDTQCVNGSCVGCPGDPPTDCAECENGSWKKQCTGANEQCVGESCVECEQSCPDSYECGQWVNSCGEAKNCGTCSSQNKSCVTLSTSSKCFSPNPCNDPNSCGVIDGNDCGDCSGKHMECSDNSCEECHYELNEGISGFNSAPLPIGGSSAVTGQFRCVWEPTSGSPSSCDPKIDTFMQNSNSGASEEDTAEAICNTQPFGNPNP